MKKTLAKPPASGNTKPDPASTHSKGISPKKGGTKGKQPLFESVEALMEYAHAMESEAAERYAEFADAMESHNNREVAELFRKLSHIESRHSQQILDSMGWKHAPTIPADAKRRQAPEHAETADSGELHYLMQPYHALKIALQNELRAQKFFARVVRTAISDTVRETAAQLEREEAEHVRLVKDWLKRTAVPDPNWAQDTDPPRNYD